MYRSPVPVSYTDRWSFGEIKAEKCIAQHRPLKKGEGEQRKASCVL